MEFTATATDVDLPADPLSYNLADGSVGSVPAGAVINSTSGDFNWTPTEAQGPGSYTFDVCVSDGSSSDCETISVEVREVVTAPVGLPDAYDVMVNDILDVSAPGLLANDSDADIPADTLTVADPGHIFTGHGELILRADGSFLYVPNSKWYGVDTFTYRVYDGINFSNLVTVTITVKPLKFFLPMILK